MALHLADRGTEREERRVSGLVLVRSCLRSRPGSACHWEKRNGRWHHVEGT